MSNKNYIDRVENKSDEKKNNDKLNNSDREEFFTDKMVQDYPEEQNTG